MSKKKKAVAAGASAAETVAAVKANPYVQRVVEDDELRDNVRVAYESAQSAYNRLAGSKGPVTKSIVDDKKLHKDLQNAAEALRDVGGAFRQAPKKKKRKGGLVRKLLVLTVGAGIALAVSSDLRNKVLDALFGAEEEFDYTSTTTPATPPPPPAPAPAAPVAASASATDSDATTADPPNSL